MSKGRKLVGLTFIGSSLGIIAGIGFIKFLSSSKRKVKEKKEIKEYITRVKSLYFGLGCIGKFTEVVKKMKETKDCRVLILAGKSSQTSAGVYEKIEKELIDEQIPFVVYDDSINDQSCDTIDKIVDKGKESNTNFVLAIGGSKIIDCGKLASLLLHPENIRKKAVEIFYSSFDQVSTIPLCVISTTFGTGSEVNKYAFISSIEKISPQLTEVVWKKSLVAVESIYPTYTIIDPRLLLSLSKEQIVYFSISTLAKLVESSTSIYSGSFSVSIAQEGITKIAKYLPLIVRNPRNIEALYQLSHASLLCGVASNESFYNISHALQNPLESFSQISSESEDVDIQRKSNLVNGKILSILLPHVVKEIYEHEGRILRIILGPICGKRFNGKKGEEVYFQKALKRWLGKMTKGGSNETLGDIGFSGDDVDKYVLLLDSPTNILYLKQSSIFVSKKDDEIYETAGKIYRQAFKKY